MRWPVAAAVLAVLLVALAVHQQGSWIPVPPDTGERGARTAFPLPRDVGPGPDGTRLYVAECGHQTCGPIAVHGGPVGGHLVLMTPDGTGARVPLAQPVTYECWNCLEGTATAIEAWGPFDGAPVRKEQAAIGTLLVLTMAAVAGAARTHALPQVAAGRALLAGAAGAILASGMAHDFGATILLDGLLAGAVAGAAGLLALARRPAWARPLAVSILWALAAFLVQGWLFAGYFPGPPWD